MKNISKIMFAASIAFIGLAGCNSTEENTSTATAAPAKVDVLAQANAQYALAIKSGFAWNKTAGLLGKAKAAMEKGDTAAAEKFAKKALKQSNDALAQADHADKHWQDYIVK